MLQKVRIRRGSTPDRKLEDRDRIVQRSSRTKVEVVFSRLQYPRIPRLVTVHTDVVGQPAWEPGRVDNCPVDRARTRRACAALLDVQPSGPMTVLAPDRKLSECRVAVKTVPPWHRLRLPAVTYDTACKDGPGKSVIVELVTRR